jgi:protease IV
MSLDADMLIDRRRLRRKLGFWRILGIVAAVIAVIALGALGANRAGLIPQGEHVARIAISGFIAYDRPLIRAIERAADTAEVRAIVLQIESPGGSTTGAEALYDAIRRAAAKKPVIAVVGTVGASGAYIAAMGADHIVAGQTSIVGSIGVLVQWAEIDQLLRTLGVRFQEIKTSPLKASPNGLEPASEEARAAIRAMITDSYEWFTGIVRTRRNLEGEALARVADGRVFTGRQAIENRLVDTLGDETTARAWLARERQVATSLPIRDYRPVRERVPGILGVTVASIAEQLGIPRSLLPSFDADEPRLDGLVSVWHPALAADR